MSVRTRVIPCLDVRDGRVVKGVNFVNPTDEGDPVELAERCRHRVSIVVFPARTRASHSWLGHSAGSTVESRAVNGIPAGAEFCVAYRYDVAVGMAAASCR